MTKNVCQGDIGKKRVFRNISLRSLLNGSRKYSGELFKKLVDDLSNSNLDGISVLLPHNLMKVEQLAITVITVNELFKRERRHPAIIL